MVNIKKIFSVGVNDCDDKIKINCKNIRCYDVWRAMIDRCYNIKNKDYNNYGYAGVCVCNEWLYFSKFKEWFDDKYPYNLEKLGVKLHLDKDLLSNDSKIYSPDTCIFLPNKVNNFLSNKYSTNTSGYTGVSWDKNRNKWVVNISDFNSNKYKKIGRFKNIEDARDAYIDARKTEVLKVKEYLRELGYDEEIINKIK